MLLSSVVAGADETQKVLEAIGRVSPAQRLALTGAALGELHGWKYGADLEPAFSALGQQAGSPELRMLMFRHLQMPLAQAGCARVVAASISLVPAQQGEYVRKSCPSTGAVFTAAQVAGVSSERVLLAILIETRAQKGGYANLPLHRKVVEVLLH